jgi:threonine dehydrogenase-like Zn-dependent dehydrogenase
VGCALAAVLRTFPLQRLELIDVDPAREPVARRLGIAFAEPQEAAGDCDLVFHCSASAGGLNRGLELLGEEGELIELSWYGDAAVAAVLGATFHARRLTVRASQVGAVAAARRARRTYQDRRALAVELLRDPTWDALITSRGPFDALPETMCRLAAGELGGLCHVVEYPMVSSPVVDDPVVDNPVEEV